MEKEQFISVLVKNHPGYQVQAGVFYDSLVEILEEEDTRVIEPRASMREDIGLESFGIMQFEVLINRRLPLPKSTDHLFPGFYGDSPMTYSISDCFSELVTYINK